MYPAWADGSLRLVFSTREHASVLSVPQISSALCSGLYPIICVLLVHVGMCQQTQLNDCSVECLLVVTTNQRPQPSERIAFARGKLPDWTPRPIPSSIPLVSHGPLWTPRPPFPRMNPSPLIPVFISIPVPIPVPIPIPVLPLPLPLSLPLLSLLLFSIFPLLSFRFISPLRSSIFGSPFEHGTHCTGAMPELARLSSRILLT